MNKFVRFIVVSVIVFIIVSVWIFPGHGYDHIGNIMIAVGIGMISIAFGKSTGKVKNCSQCGKQLEKAPRKGHYYCLGCGSTWMEKGYNDNY